ncbi:hypothetical protein NDU88_007970 [Pleurodeles waltl]|uniref:Uncharacterized protein n=1 Tax=Pleurodeles waltl TaxID=8319 RepID=A0AAV7QM60_PLEWA|nr:hypothetical protein NDU88_007970 [Pleurodeles waltl]
MPRGHHKGGTGIWIPTVEKPAERLREREDDGSGRTKTDEDDAQTGDNPDQEDAVTGERQHGRPSEEESRPGQLTPTEDLDGESPETKRLCHIPGGAFLQPVRSCLQSRLNVLVGKEEGERGKKGLMGGGNKGGRDLKKIMGTNRFLNN